MKAALKHLYIGLMVSGLLLQSGCWSAVELNERSFARIMLLDQTEKGIEVTLGFPLPNRMPAQPGGGGGGGASESEKFTYMTKTAATLGDAYRQIQADVSRRITFGQLRNIVLSRSYAEKGLESLADFTARIPNFHINSNIFVTEGRVRQFTQLPLTFERFPTDILTAYAKNQDTLVVSVKDVLASLYHGGDFALAMLAFGRQGAAQEKSGRNWMGTNGAALMQGGKLVGTLSSTETRGAMWITGKLRNAEFDIRSPEDGKNISLFVVPIETKVKPNLNGDLIRIHIMCKANARVIMSNSAINLSDPRQLRRVEKVLEKDLEERINMAVDKAREARTDAFQLGSYVEWRYPRQWKQMQPGWRQRWATEVKVVPHADIRVKSFGAVRKPEWARIVPSRGGPS